MGVPGLDPGIVPAIHVFADRRRSDSLARDARRLGLHSVRRR